MWKHHLQMPISWIPLNNGRPLTAIHHAASLLKRKDDTARAVTAAKIALAKMRRGLARTQANYDTAVQEAEDARKEFEDHATGALREWVAANESMDAAGFP